MQSSKRYPEKEPLAEQLKLCVMILFVVPIHILLLPLSLYAAIADYWRKR